MRLIAICLLVVGVCGLLLTGCAKEEETPGTTPPAKVDMPEKPAADAMKTACVCEQGKEGGTVWCAECNCGYVKGEKTECKDCFASAETGKGKCEQCAKQ
jgi:hypothetical protein